MNKISKFFDKTVLTVLRNSYLKIIKDIGQCKIVDNKQLEL